MDLTILVNFSQICLREISFKVDLMILIDFSQFLKMQSAWRI